MANKMCKVLQVGRLNKLIILLLIGAFVMLYFSRSEVTNRKLHKLQEVVKKFDNAKGNVEYNGKIYVPYKDEEVITAKIYSNKNCIECVSNIEIIKKYFKKAIPALIDIEVVTESKDFSSSVAYPMSVVFSENVKNTVFFKEAEQFFYKVDDGYGFYVHALDLEINTFETAPSGGLVGIESDSAKDSLVLFVSVDCPECDIMNDVMTVLETQYGNKIKTSYLVTADEKVRLNQISKGIYCASEQNKGIYYLNRVLNNQKVWKKYTSVDKVLYNYNIALGVNTSKHKACMKSKKANEFLLAQEQEFIKFGVTKVPTLFINNKKFEGVQTIANINKELSK